MTREEISKSLKPLEWDIWDGGKYRFANIAEAYEAMVMTKDDGNFLVKINKRGVIGSYMCTTVTTIQEADAIVREWQIDHICSYFQMND